MLKENDLKGCTSRVLLIEDSRDFAQLAGEMLEASGPPLLEVVHAASLEEGLLRLDQAFDLVLLDLSLPDANGLESLTRLRDHVETPIVVLTGTHDDFLGLSLVRHGAEDYLVKGQIKQDLLARSVRYAIVRNRLKAEQKKAEEETLKETNRRLEEAVDELKRTQQKIVQQERLRALGQMASGIAHDFNNALTPILGFSELLLAMQGTPDGATVERYGQLINMAAQDAATLVGRLREFYRQRDEGEEFSYVNLQDIIAQAFSLTQTKWKDEAQANGIAIQIETELQEIPEVLGSESELREGLTNLILNAVDAMPEGGTITIRCRSEADWICVEVSDTGIGMSEEHRQTCMDPFFTTKGSEGTGMGLAMVYGIVQRHEGSIDIESEVGEGTTFVLRLPLKDRAALLDEQQAVSSAVRSLHVLAVDDEPAVRELVVEFLKRDGHTAEIATNGAEGLEMFQAASFDLVLTDRAMPKMSGDQLAATIRTEAPDQPIIMLTGFGEIMHATNQKPADVNLVISKPITSSGLRRAIAEVMEMADSGADVLEN